MASVEALHLLHCLNMLRQATYEDYYKDKPGPWEDSPQVLRFHLGELAISYEENASVKLTRRRRSLYRYLASEGMSFYSGAIATFVHKLIFHS